MEKDNDIVVFGKYANPVDANIIKGVLESNGITAGVMEDDYSNVMLMAPVRVMVMRRDLERAREVLESAPEAEACHYD